jgi:hypothetical protein
MMSRLSINHGSLGRCFKLAYRIIKNGRGGFTCFDGLIHVDVETEDEAKAWFAARDEKHTADYEAANKPPEAGVVPAMPDEPNTQTENPRLQQVSRSN